MRIADKKREQMKVRVIAENNRKYCTNLRTVTKVGIELLVLWLIKTLRAHSPTSLDVLSLFLSLALSRRNVVSKDLESWWV